VSIPDSHGQTTAPARSGAAGDRQNGWVSTPSDLVRAIAVAVLAVVQVAAGPLTMLALGPSSNNAAISDANTSPVTPAGYAFSIWGLIYLACLAFAVYQLLPGQRGQEVHRRSGWWLAAAFFCSAVWLPIFGTRTLWLAQVVIVALVFCLVMAVVNLSRCGPAAAWRERLLLRLPATLYLGWATLASSAGFGTTFRSLGMPERAGWVTGVSVALIAAAAAVSLFVVTRETATVGFVFTACWALIGIVVATFESPVRFAALAAFAVLIAVTVARTVRSRQPTAVLFG
jgi:benzodiazapine receptor